MKITTKKLPQNRIELTVELEPAETAPYMGKGAEILSKKHKVDGFRAGKVPLEIMKQKFGEGHILEEALDSIVKHTYLDAIHQEKLETVDAPDIEILKLAPGNPLIYKATVSLLPNVKIGDLSKVKVTKKEIKVDEKKVDSTIKTIAESRSIETVADKAIGENDIAEIDLELLRDKVAIEGGTSHNHKVIVGDPHYIPEFDKQIIGLKKGDKKEFEVIFPDEHYDKKLAGKPVECRIEVKNVYERTIPKIDDAFAKTLGKFANLAELKEKIKENLIHEAEHKEKQRQEIEMIEGIIKESTIDEIPVVLLKEEARKMISELESNLAQQGLKLDDYLTHLKKSAEELKQDFLPQAEKRVQTALLIRQFAVDNKVEVDDKDVDKEIEHTISHYPEDIEAHEQIRSENYKNYIRNTLMNKKVINIFRDKIIK